MGLLLNLGTADMQDLGTCRARCKNYNDRARACSFEKGVLEGHREFEKGVLERRLGILRGRKRSMWVWAQEVVVLCSQRTHNSLKSPSSREKWRISHSFLSRRARISLTP